MTHGGQVHQKAKCSLHPCPLEGCCQVHRSPSNMEWCGSGWWVPTSVSCGCLQSPSSRSQPFLPPQPHPTAPTCVQCAPTRQATCSAGSHTGASPDSYACGGHILLLSTPHPIPAWTCVCQQRPLLCTTSDTISASTDSPWYPSRSAQVRPTTCILGSLYGDFNLSPDSDDFQCSPNRS